MPCGTIPEVCRSAVRLVLTGAWLRAIKQHHASSSACLVETAARLALNALLNHAALPTQPSGAPISLTVSDASVSSVYNFTYTLTYEQSAQLDVTFKANGSLAASYSLGVFSSGNDTTQVLSR